MDSQPSILTKADILFDLQLKISSAEYELTNMFEKFSASFDWEDFSYDYYDHSLEIFRVPEEFGFNKEDLNMLRNYGFAQVWIHTRQKNSDKFDTVGTRYYNLRG